MLTRHKKTVVFLLDYDACADILSAKYFHDRPYHAIRAEIIAKQRELFLAYLKNIVHKAEQSFAGDVEVAVYVGSRRQDIATDEIGAKVNSNGSCFETYRKLCEENGWIFHSFLIADVGNVDKNDFIKNPAGYFKDVSFGRAMQDRKLSAVHLDSDDKVPLLVAMLMYAAMLCKDSPIDFHFIDDDSHGDKIFSNLITHFQNHPHQVHHINLTFHRHIRLMSDMQQWYIQKLQKKKINEEMNWSGCINMEEMANFHAGKIYINYAALQVMFIKIPLFGAAVSGDAGHVRFLAQKGEDLNVVWWEDGATAAYLAASLGHSDVIKVLAEAGADLTKAKKDGITPALAAAYYNREAVLIELANAGIDLAQQSPFGTPLQMARKGHASKCVAYLEAYMLKKTGSSQMRIFAVSERLPESSSVRTEGFANLRNSREGQ